MEYAELLQQLDALHSDSVAWARVCCRRDTGGSEAEDVLQTAYVQVLDGRARFDGRSSFKTWLFAVIRRTAAAERRRQILRRLLLERRPFAVPAPAPAPSPSADVEQTERALRLRTALDELPPRQHGVLDLVFYHGLTIEESASIMGIGVGTARTHYERGKKRLATLLNGDLR